MGAGLFSTTPIILLLFHGLPSLLPPPLPHIYIHYKSSTNSACISVFCALSPFYLGLVRVTVWGLRPEAFPDITRLHWGLNFLVLALHFLSLTLWPSRPPCCLYKFEPFLSALCSAPGKKLAGWSILSLTLNTLLLPASSPPPHGDCSPTLPGFPWSVLCFFSLWSFHSNLIS